MPMKVVVVAAAVVHRSLILETTSILFDDHQTIAMLQTELDVIDWLIVGVDWLIVD